MYVVQVLIHIRRYEESWEQEVPLALLSRILLAQSCVTLNLPEYVERVTHDRTRTHDSNAKRTSCSHDPYITMFIQLNDLCTLLYA